MELKNTFKKNDATSLFFLARTTQLRPIRPERGAVVTSKGPGIRGDMRGRGGPVSATLREITINS